MSAKGPGQAQKHDGSNLRIGILHSRWNDKVITALVSGARKALIDGGVPEANIVTQSVPGAYELPLAVQRMHAAGQTSSSSTLVSAAQDLLGSSTDLTATTGEKKGTGAGGPLDAIIAIGVLIKGSTMHFEYIADAVSHGLMRVQLDAGVPVIFGLLTCLNEEQAEVRSGLRTPEKKEGAAYGEQGHNHGEDWGKAAIEMAVKRKAWGEGSFVE